MITLVELVGCVVCPIVSVERISQHELRPSWLPIEVGVPCTQARALFAPLETREREVLTLLNLDPPTRFLSGGGSCESLPC